MKQLRRLAGPAVLALGVACGAAPAALSAPPLVTPASVLAAAPDADWTTIDPHDLLVIDLAGGGRVVILLADSFAPVHVGNIRKLAAAHWYDGLAIERVQDNYVVQWGDPDGKKALPAGLTNPAPAEYDRPAEGLPFPLLPYPDPYAKAVGVSGGLPVGEDGGRAWLTHCYGMVGVGRDLNPDTGTGAELYAVIGTPPRALDRNIAVVGRVLRGMELLAALPRGTADLGFYAKPEQRTEIIRIRIATDLPAADQPHMQVLRETSASFRAWIQAKANRQDTFFVRPAGALDVCNAMPPVRGAGRVGM
ncbi:MAG TPA: peptidylprolyl isomerase [Caulobacteraceae bacterium]|jgi:peptidylprolyl isomerase|nr:peptidylprolyl isomerase [Caulobacteraceae bacterium]